MNNEELPKLIILPKALADKYIDLKEEMDALETVMGECVKQCRKQLADAAGRKRALRPELLAACALESDALQHYAMDIQGDAVALVKKDEDDEDDYPEGMPEVLKEMVKQMKEHAGKLGIPVNFTPVKLGEMQIVESEPTETISGSDEQQSHTA